MKKTNYYKQVCKALPRFVIAELGENKFSASSNDSQFTYIIDAANGVVIASITENFRHFDTHRARFATLAGEYCREIRRSPDFEAMQNRPSCQTFKGKAKCMDSDDFDISKGVRIARFRALKKLYKERNARYKDFVYVTARMLVKFNNEQSNIEKKISQYDKLITTECGTHLCD